MRAHGQKPQIVMTTPLLVGTDGREENGEIVGNKMSKSYDNYVGVSEPPEEQFGKLMSISDGLMWHYYDLLSERTTDELAELRSKCESGMNPKEAKVALAHEIVARYHDAAAADEAQKKWDLQFSKREVPEDMPERQVAMEEGGVWLPKALVAAELLPSTSEGRRRIQQGGVQIDGKKVSDVQLTLQPGRYVIKAGKRAWAVVNVTD